MQEDKKKRTLLFSRNRLLLLLSLLTAFLFVRWQWPTLFAWGAVSADEQVIWFPTVGHLSDDRKHLIADIHGWVFEPEDDDAVRAVVVAGLRKTLGLAADAPESSLLDRRVRAFLVDNERGKELEIRYGLRRFKLPPTGSNGSVLAEIKVPMLIVGVGSRWQFQTVLPAGDDREFLGVVHYLSSRGLSVISDIDDTIKVSHVTDKAELMRRTFLEEFEAVPGMVELFQRWHQDNQAKFHFVSGSPWQLYPELAKFAKNAGFPDATYYLRSVRFKDKSALELVGDPIAFKVGKIAPLIERFEKRRFVLVGDSGEKDPEVYGEIARRFPKQVVRIFIRNVTREDPKSQRFRDAMRKVPHDVWLVFDRPDGLQIPK